MSQTQEIRIQSKVDAKAEWEKANLVLLDREVGYERETGKYKIGDGIHGWNDLSYSNEFDDTYIVKHIQNNIVHITNDDRNNWNNKSDKGHKHTISDVTDFPTSMPASDVYSWAKASTKPTYTASEVGAAPSSHTHDDRYYTESEIDTKLSDKANSSHTHTASQVTGVAPAYTYSTTDIGAGSVLETGKLYFVYE